MKYQTLKFFLNRIGKRVYRKEDTCTCDTCKDVALNGIVIYDEMHARCLYDAHREMGFNYFDEPVNELKTTVNIVEVPPIDVNPK